MIVKDRDGIPLRIVRTPAEAACFLPSAMKRHTTERFYVVALNPRNHVLGIQCVARGTYDSCPVDPRQVFRFCLIKRASALVVAHNHPSGDATPSSFDLKLTEQLARGAVVLGLKLLDHLIIARGGGFHSFVERGEMQLKTQYQPEEKDHDVEV